MTTDNTPESLRAFNNKGRAVTVQPTRRVALIVADGTARVFDRGAAVTVTVDEWRERPDWFRGLNGETSPRDAWGHELRVVRMFLGSAGFTTPDGLALSLDGSLRQVSARDARHLVGAHRAAYADSWEEAANRLPEAATYEGPYETVRLRRAKGIHLYRESFPVGAEVQLPPADARQLVNAGDADWLDDRTKQLEALLESAGGNAGRANPTEARGLAAKLAEVFGWRTA